ncbi:Kinesin-like protein KIN-5C [Dionaea muscipula]
MSSRNDREKGVNVQVLLRCRPFSDEELRSNAPQVVTCNDYQREVAVSQNIAGKHIDRVFTFDKVFGPSAQQKDLYEQAIVPIVNEVLEGFNCTIFAYGQTGTGKTYTMEGNCKRSKSVPTGELPAEAGVIPRAINQIFDTLERQNAEYSVKVTFLELYNEEITDLLAPEEISRVVLDDRQKKQLPLMEDGKGGVLVRGLEEEIVTSASEIFTLLERGSAKRRTAETLLNKQSSRSHSLFSITIHIKEATPEGEELIKCGKLNLVDLAGSENISRSGAREGRAREAGEINKSLLTLGRVINALVEHLGHIPYRDSKLTRLLRDSLGGRTKTCIIATVSPAVHCLEETLSTLDYAHRAKNIKNKPEVNQKMMKSTLIKDLYGEIERLKGEVYAAREKNGVYIPKDRYYQEENERKAMADQIEQMGATIENQQKQLEEVQSRYDVEVQHCSDLSSKLDSTQVGYSYSLLLGFSIRAVFSIVMPVQKQLNVTRKLLTATEEEVMKCKYVLKEKDFVISEQRKAEDALAQQACNLQSDLEKALQNNNSLYSKIAREDKLNADNKSIVMNYQENLAAKIGSLCTTAVSSMSKQKEQLKCTEKLCHSLLDTHNEAIAELKKKVTVSRTLYLSHIEGLQNVVRLHRASSDASLEEITALASSEARSVEEFLHVEAGEATSIHDDLQATLSSHQGEMVLFARDLQKRFHDSIEHSKEISEFINLYLHNILEELGRLGCHASQVEEIQMKNISEFQRSFEEQSKSNAEKLIAEMTDLVNNHMLCQQKMVDARLADQKESAVVNKRIFDGHISAMDSITTDAKRKWHAFSVQADYDANNTVHLSAAKHCRIEQLLQHSMSAAETASKHWKRTHESLNEMSTKHVLALGSIVRNASNSNEQHIAEVDAARCAAEKDTLMSTEDIGEHLDNLSKRQQGDVSGIFSCIKAQADDLEVFREDHTSQASCIEIEAQETFQRRYLEYEPTGTTPEKCDPDVPSKGTIESLRAMPIDALVEEFRENHNYEAADEKQTRPSLIPRSPLAEVN